MIRTLAACALVGLAACSSPRGGSSTDGAVTGNPDGTGGIFNLSITDKPTARVYAHAATSLFSINPDTLAITKIGPFQWPNGTDAMTDIALDKDGNMFGISSTRVYSIDKSNAKCTFLSNFQGNEFNGLSFIAADQNGGTEILVGAAANGDVYRINPATGMQTFIGSYGSGYGSSGDLVSVQGATYATASSLADDYDVLVKIDAKTGKATRVGLTGTEHIYGLGYWKQKLFGFSEMSGVVSIDVNTGAATPIPGGGSIAWYGAGVTTSAPITVQ